MTSPCAARPERPDRLQVGAVLEELHRAVAHQHVAPAGVEAAQREHAGNVDAARPRSTLQLGYFGFGGRSRLPRARGVDAEGPALAEQHGPRYAARCRRRLGAGGEPGLEAREVGDRALPSIARVPRDPGGVGSEEDDVLWDRNRDSGCRCRSSTRRRRSCCSCRPGCRGCRSSGRWRCTGTRRWAVRPSGAIELEGRPARGEVAVPGRGDGRRAPGLRWSRDRRADWPTGRGTR